MFFWICFILAFIPLVLIFPIKKIGKKSLKQLKGKNYIISCNHTSNLDPVMLDITFKKKLRFLAKKELFVKKFPSAVLKSYGGIPVDRQKADLTAIKETMRLINNKKIVCIFPQGTRSKTIKIEESSAKEGVAMFSIRTNTPVVPMMFSSKIKAFRKTKLYIGEPIYPDVNRQKEKEYVAEFANLIIDKMNSLLEGEKQ